MNAGALLYLIIMGILECWVGIILYIVAMVKKSNKLFLTGLVLQLFFCFGNLAGSGARIDGIAGLIFFIIFSGVTYIVVNWENK